MWSALVWKCFIIGWLMEFSWANIHVVCRMNSESRQTFEQSKHTLKPIYDCKVLETSFISRSSHEPTAPAPTLHQPTWFIFQQNERMFIGLNVTWVQSGSHVLNLVKGYLVYIQLSTSYTKEFQVKFSSSPSHHISAMVCFNFLCQDKHLVRPESSYSIGVMSLPVHYPNTHIQWSEKRKIEIPEHVLLKENDMTQVNGNNEVAASRLSILCFTLGTALLVTIIGATFYLCAVMKGRKLTVGKILLGKHTDTSLLLLINTRDENNIYLEAGNLLASMLGGSLEFNLWKRSNIFDSTEWLEENLRKCDHVLFICTPQGKFHYDELLKGREDCNIFASALRLYGTRHEKTSVATAVYFNNNNVCVPECLNNHVKSFKLLEALNDFRDHLHNKCSAIHFNECSPSCDSLKQTIKKIRRSSTQPFTNPWPTTRV